MLSFEINHHTIVDLKIADPRTVFRGLTYGQWAAVWLNHLMSDQPDINYSESGGKGMVFLRANVEYAHKDDPQRLAYTLMTRDSRLIIREDTAVFVPVINTMFVLDDEYQGFIMKDEISMRNIARRDTVYGGPIGVRITGPSPLDKSYHLVNDLNDFYIESPLFPLRVSEKNPYKYTMEIPLEAGQYYAVSVGVYVIISNWPKGLFRLSIFGRGVGKYLTRAIYDIQVIDDCDFRLEDISKLPGPAISRDPGDLITDPMDFVADWKKAKVVKEPVDISNSKPAPNPEPAPKSESNSDSDSERKPKPKPKPIPKR